MYGENINLYEETMEIMEENGLTKEDIEAILITSKKIKIQVNQMKEFMDFSYDDGYGSHEIDDSLVIIFKDNSLLQRWEYDGSEGWEYITPNIEHTDYTYCTKKKQLMDNY